MFAYLDHILALLAAVLVLAVVCYSRDRSRKRITITYIIDIEQPQESFAPADWQIIADYFQQNDLPLGTPEIFNGKDLADCDARCEAYMHKLTSKIDIQAMRQQGLSDSARFTYSAYRFPEKNETVEASANADPCLFFGRVVLG